MISIANVLLILISYKFTQLFVHLSISIFNSIKYRYFREITNFQFIDKSINPYVDEWEAQRHFPAHTLFKKLGSLGIFGVNKPTGKISLFSRQIPELEYCK